MSKRQPRQLVLAILLAQGLAAFTGAAGAQDQGTSLRQPIMTPQSVPSPEVVLKDQSIAYRLAKANWLPIAAHANPRLIAAICAHPGPAKVLAKHRHLDRIADADHYLCRRLTRWPDSTQKLIRNKYCDKVIALDPEGIYVAMERNPQVACLLARHPNFNQMMYYNSDLGNQIARHMK
jgi:hypothetical protein